MDDGDRQRLIDFVAATGDDIGWVVERFAEIQEPDDPTSGTVVDLASRAWEDILARGELEMLQKAIASEIYDERLDRVGLSGASLEFKLAVVRAAHDDARGGGDEPGPRRRALVRRLLDAIDVVLDSLVGALHGIGEVLREFKGALRARIED
ncbi:MAG: hypothetical protein QOJ82_2430 [Solirubrobacteraceae bacterium]|jgi:hypothetical protein|nr:hypothetical protein [Solirubrobacteraceae bacterium]